MTYFRLVNAVRSAENLAMPAAPPQLAPAPAGLIAGRDVPGGGAPSWTQGSVAPARQFFRRAADMGHGLVSLRLAPTLDPFELAGAAVVGLQPDPKEAATWYERARELGMPDATQRLSRLQSRR